MAGVELPLRMSNGYPNGYYSDANELFSGHEDGSDTGAGLHGLSGSIDKQTDPRCFDRATCSLDSTEYPENHGRKLDNYTFMLSGDQNLHSLPAEEPAPHLFDSALTRSGLSEDYHKKTLLKHRFKESGHQERHEVDQHGISQSNLMALRKYNASNIAKGSGTTSSVPASKQSSLSSGGSSASLNTIINKRPGDKSEFPGEVDSNGRDVKRIKNDSTRLGNQAPVKFACPYRKFNPSKYSIFEWRTCALSHWDTVARLKEHLYRTHKKPSHCSKCWRQFKQKSDLERHYRDTSIVCEITPGGPPEGISEDLLSALRSRKTFHSNQSEEEKWFLVYKMLFPGEPLPNSPYFETLQEDALQSSDLADLNNYEEYVRRELPRLIRSAFEEAIRREAQPLEARLMSSLVRLIQGCQDTLFSNYRSQVASNPGAPIVPLPSDDSKIQVPRSSISDDISPGTSAYSTFGGTLSDCLSVDTNFQPLPQQRSPQHTNSSGVDQMIRTLDLTALLGPEVFADVHVSQTDNTLLPIIEFHGSGEPDHHQNLRDYDEPGEQGLNHDWHELFDSIGGWAWDK